MPKILIKKNFAVRRKRTKKTRLYHLARVSQIARALAWVVIVRAPADAVRLPAHAVARRYEIRVATDHALDLGSVVLVMPA